MTYQSNECTFALNPISSKRRVEAEKEEEKSLTERKEKEKKLLFSVFNFVENGKEYLIDHETLHGEIVYLLTTNEEKEKEKISLTKFYYRIKLSEGRREE